MQSYKISKKLITKHLTRTWYPKRDRPSHRLGREHPGRAAGRRRRVVAHHLGRGAATARLLRRRRRLADKGHKVGKVVVTAAAAAGPDRRGFLMVFGRGADLLGGVVGGGGEVPAASARWQACRAEKGIQRAHHIMTTGFLLNS